jgi:dTDP-4-amino-4,6-dideoxygalactose transaminase
MFDTLFQFEAALAEYTGAPYVVATDGCTHAIELAMRYYQVEQCSFTAYTYISVVQCMRQLDIKYQLTDEFWQGEYQFHGTNIWDSARRLEPGMYRSGQVQCVSFGNGKPMQLGRVGAVLLDDVQAYQAISCMRSDGRNLKISPWISQQHFDSGYHYCPTLEDCARGLEKLPTIQPQRQQVQYPDLRKISFNH